MSRREIEISTVDNFLTPITREAFENEMMRRRTGSRLTDPELHAQNRKTGLHIEDKGDGITTSGPAHFSTFVTFKGSRHALSHNTYVKSENFVIPEGEITLKSTEAFLMDRTLPQVAFSYIYFNDPGNGLRIRKRELSSFLLFENSVIDSPKNRAAEAVAAYLNGELNDYADDENLQERLKMTNIYLRELFDIHFDEEFYDTDFATPDDLIAEVLFQANKPRYQ